MAGALLCNCLALQHCDYMIYVIASAITGLAAGIIYMVGVLIILSWFIENKRVAMAFYSFTNGIITVTLQNVTTSVTLSYGLSGAFVLLVVLLGIVCAVVTALATFGPNHQERSLPLSACLKEIKYTLSNRLLWLYFGVLVLAWAPGWAVLSNLNVLLRQRMHIDESDASRIAIVPLTGLLVGRLCTGFFPRRVSNENILSLLNITQCVVCFVCTLPIASGVGAFLGLSTILTSTFGATSSMYAPYAMELFSGDKAISMQVGFSCCAYGVSALYASLLFGAVTTDWLFLIMSASAAAAVVGNFVLARLAAIQQTASRTPDVGSF
jgi:predicted MFS family arabinose efflux permease